MCVCMYILHIHMHIYIDMSLECVYAHVCVLQVCMSIFELMKQKLPYHPAYCCHSYGKHILRIDLAR